MTAEPREVNPADTRWDGGAGINATRKMTAAAFKRGGNQFSICSGLV